jgi:hypothetical protein
MSICMLLVFGRVVFVDRRVELQIRLKWIRPVPHTRRGGSVRRTTINHAGRHDDMRRKG